MTMTSFGRSRSLDDLRAAHRAERAPGELRERLRVHFAVAPSSEAIAGRGWRNAFWRWPSPAGLCAVSGAGALLISVIARPLMQPRDDAGAAGSAPTVSSVGQSKSGRPCPLQELRSGAFFEPSSTIDPIGVSVHELQVTTPSCGPLARHYHQLLPASPPPRTSAPVVIALHDRGRDAGWLRVQETRWYFDALAKREGLVLVYANAAPSAATDPRWDNSGGWQTDADAHPEIDDVAYLASVVSDLKARGVVSGNNDVFLVGVGAGATMALAAAARQPDRYTGVAAFMPSRVEVGARPHLPDSRLSRVLIVTRSSPEGIWEGSELQGSAERWAAAVGVRGASPVAPPEARRASSAGMAQFDLAGPSGTAPGVRVLMLDEKSDPFPPPGASDPLALAASRRRPHFIDGAELAWRFLRQPKTPG